jgi:hypothetical protein
MITRLKELEVENSRLKKMYVDERLKAMIVQEALTFCSTPPWSGEKVLRPSLCKERARQAINDH